MSIASALSEFRAAAVAAREEIRPLNVMMDGIEYAVAGRLGEIRKEQTETGIDTVQEVTARIPKTLIEGVPDDRGKITAGGHEFVIVAIGGAGDDSLVWIISGKRVI